MAQFISMCKYCLRNIKVGYILVQNNNFSPTNSMVWVYSALLRSSYKHINKLDN